MAHRRILSLWFPRLGAERLLRRAGLGPETPLAVVREQGGARLLASLSPGAEAAGLHPGQPLRDAHAMCPDLLTRPHDPEAATAMLAALRRWAGRYSPWVAEEAPDALVVDLTGCAHLFGGEAALLEQVAQDCAGLGLSVRSGIADTLGAAWALARHAGGGAPGAMRSGDAIDQEARATRARAARRPERPAAPPAASGPAGAIAAVGQTRQALAPLPVAALRLSAEDAAGLGRLGVRRIGDLAGLPRAALARRFGQSVMRRLDQALGLEPEPVSPAKPPPRFALRLRLPDPIGLQDDVAAGIDRLLPALCTRLARAGRGARQVRLQALRCDHGVETAEVGLARPSADPDRIRPLLMLKLDGLDAGPGIDVLRLEAVQTEPVHARQHKGHFDAAAGADQGAAARTALDDLIGRLGARIGSAQVTRLHPADSHIPEKTAQVQAAAWSEPASDWPVPPAPRPLLLWPPEPVRCSDPPGPPQRFRWRRQDLVCAAVRGPERIAPEWWLDEPAWRSGTRDYWDVTTENGMRLWLYYAHGHEMAAGWFCQGRFA